MQIICRDLWALHLSLLPSPPPPEPLLHQQATQGHVSNHTSEETDAQGEKASADLSDPSSSEGDDIEGDADIEDLLRELSESSFSEDDKDDKPAQPRPRPEASGRKLKPFSGNGPVSNIALLMVACWTLRLPVMYLDLIRLECGMSFGRRVADRVRRLIESYDLPYLEALHYLPTTMVRHLTKHNVQALSPAVRAHVYTVRNADDERANVTACTNSFVIT